MNPAETNGHVFPPPCLLLLFNITAELLESMGIKRCQRLTENPGEVAEFSGSVAPQLDRCHGGA